MPDVIKRYADLGITAQASSGEELRKRLAAEIKKWSAVIDNAKIQRL
jgi:tripartite-type tricarboxylate transporter receptor subunit TctC